MTIYRKLWEENFGPIPRDESGRSYEIHHIDGNRNNNKLENLICISIEEHYDIHKSQGDWGACLALSKRLNKSFEEISSFASKLAKKRILDGTHNFTINGDKNQRNCFSKLNKKELSELNRKIANDRVSNKTHPFLGDRGRKIVADQIKRGTHPSLRKHTCPHCNKTGKGNIMFKWHFENCKLKLK